MKKNVANKTNTDEAISPLAGRGMHWLDEEGKVQWQGKVVGDLGGGNYLIQLFGWIAGEPTQQIIVNISELAVTTRSTKGRAVFYNSTEEMNEYYEQVLSHRQ
jgi:hypothetical protein